MVRDLTGARIILLLLSVMMLGSCGGGGGSPAVSASFTSTSSTSNTLPVDVDFDATASTGNIANYIWDFGDGSITALGETTSHTYRSFGDFTVTLTVTTAAGTDPVTTTQAVRVNGSLSLSGRITAQPGSVQDSDINDPLANFISNDTPATAQNVSNPVIIGGFASFDGTGIAIDRFDTVGDVFDVYRVTLGANQTINMSVSDATPGNNLDLYLFDATDTNLFGGSCGSANSPAKESTNIFPVKSESLKVGADGEYYVVVCAMSGRTNYVLTIGNTTVLNIAAIDELDDFIPGEVIVKFDDDDALVSNSKSLSSRAVELGLIAKVGGPGRPMLFQVGDENNRKQAFSMLGIPQNKSISRLTKTEAQLLKDETFSIIRALRLRDDVKSADLNYIRKAFTTNDPLAQDQWHYADIGLPMAWDLLASEASAAGSNVSASNIIVAVIDTGVVTGHSDLTANLVAGYDFILSPQNSNDGDGRDADPNDPGDSVSGSSSFHGTHVSGTIAAVSDNGDGVAGVTWNTNTKVMPLRVLGINGGTSFDIMAAIEYAVGLENDEETAVETAARVAAGNVAHIINLSLGGGSFSQTEQDVFARVRTAQVIVVAAAGNSGTDAPGYPASYDGVVSVGAVARKPNSSTDPVLASYSNTGAFIDLVAPGGDSSVQNSPDNVLSTSADDSQGAIIPGYRFLRGTSMASPHVAGVAALIKSVYPDLSPDDFDNLLLAGVLTDDLSGNGLGDGASVRNDIYGFGSINALKAVQQAIALRLNNGQLPPFLSVNPSFINFMEPDSVVILNADNPASGTVTIDNVSVDVPWLAVAPTVNPGVDANLLGERSVTVDRTGLDNAQYQGTITIAYTIVGNGIGTINIPVTMQVGPVSSTGDTGYQYAILADFDLMVSNSFADPTVASLTLGSPVNGLYDFSFEGIGNGNYVILAGSDLDNDFSLCDAGEACGLFPFVIGVSNRSITGLNFISRYDTGIGTTSGFSRNVYSPMIPVSDVKMDIMRINAR